MYRQAIDPGSAAQLVTPSGNTNFYLAGLSPDRTGILLEGEPIDIGFDYWWQLSPDGSRIGIVKKHGNQIRLVPLSGGPTTTITINGYSDLLEFYWTIDSQSMFVSTFAPGGAILLHVSLSGDAHPIWHRRLSTHTWDFPSPDGRHLAIFSSNSESNVWMINNF